jgi:hypothetical protein
MNCRYHAHDMSMKNSGLFFSFPDFPSSGYFLKELDFVYHVIIYEI